MPPSSVCRGCANPLSNCNAGVDIFGQDASSDSREDNNNIKRGIEIITGLTVSDTDGLPGRLCTDCNNKLGEFLAFRTQLLSSLRVFRSSDNTSGKSELSLEAIGSAPTPLAPTQNNCNDKLICESKEEVKIEVEISNQENRNREESTIAVIGARNENEHFKELVNKINVIEYEDAESDIDVCSGEDDGVLELDVQSKKDEIYEIQSSSDESDIQVCDFEPNELL